ncbi:MAG: ubiquitin-like domain-containing protein, partial [Oscillospiraceae bacterium]|nr:ubiquitin-like domain-containing protein [Oscillospiraceae bacterium]
MRLATASKKKRPRAILRENHISLGAYDKIEITRAYGVNIKADGKVTTVGCYNNTVAELLERAGVTLDK